MYTNNKLSGGIQYFLKRIVSLEEAEHSLYIYVIYTHTRIYIFFLLYIYIYI